MFLSLAKSDDEIFVAKLFFLLFGWKNFELGWVYLAKLVSAISISKSVFET